MVFILFYFYLLFTSQSQLSASKRESRLITTFGLHSAWRLFLTNESCLETTFCACMAFKHLSTFSRTNCDVSFHVTWPLLNDCFWCFRKCMVKQELIQLAKHMTFGILTIYVRNFVCTGKEQVIILDWGWCRQMVTLEI